MELYDNKRKVMLVRGDKSKQYEQAIFILRDGALHGQIDFVKEAERIINASSRSGAVPPTHNQIPKKATKNASRIDILLNLAIFAVGITIVALLFLNLL